MELTTKNTFKELALAMYTIKSEIDELGAAKTKLQKQFDILRHGIVPEKLEDEGMQNITIKGIGRLGASPMLQVSVPAGNREKLEEWMYDNDFGELVKGTINSSTLKAWVKEQMEKGAEIPEDLITVRAFMMATLTKT